MGRDVLLSGFVVQRYTHTGSEAAWSTNQNAELEITPCVADSLSFYALRTGVLVKIASVDGHSF